MLQRFATLLQKSVWNDLNCLSSAGQGSSEWSFTNFTRVFSVSQPDLRSSSASMFFSRPTFFHSWRSGFFGAATGAAGAAACGPGGAGVAGAGAACRSTAGVAAR